MMVETIKKIHSAGQTQEFISAMTARTLLGLCAVLYSNKKLYDQLLEALVKEGQMSSEGGSLSV
jgi:hypothetical protein